MHPGGLASGSSYLPLAVFIIGAMPEMGGMANSLGTSHTPKRMGVTPEAPFPRRQKLARQNGRRRGGWELAGKLQVTCPRVDFFATISGEDSARWGKRPP